ncbi:MAG: hypothetical protein U9N45_08435, partial [Gemmatimonadota bacterium]|nr:hypothetical protein [Gemmatimonadota bacterium]
MKQLIKNPLGLAALVLILLAVLLPAVAYIGYSSNLENLDRMLYSKGSALMQTVLHEAENAVLAEGEIKEELSTRLADNARFMLLLDKRGILDETSLREIAETNGLARCDLYSPDGAIKASSKRTEAPAGIPVELARGPLEEGYIVSAFITTEEPGGSDESRDTGRELFAVGIRAPDSTLAAVYADPEELFQLRHRLGIGLILDDLSAIVGVTYAVLQDTLGIIAASSQVALIGSIREDAFFPVP